MFRQKLNSEASMQSNCQRLLFARKTLRAYQTEKSNTKLISKCSNFHHVPVEKMISIVKS